MKKVWIGIFLLFSIAFVSYGATNFPTSLDSYSTKAAGNTITEVHTNDPQDAIEALEAKVGIGSSTVETSHDYLLANIPVQVPSGLIALWSGAVSAIPDGWVICDGNNSTPNLTDRFVIHADDDSGGTNDVGDTGGSKTISISNMPAHKHTFAQTSGASGAGSYHVAQDNDGYTNIVYTDPARDTSSVGSGTNYMPKYYALAYIMKT